MTMPTTSQVAYMNESSYTKPAIAEKSSQEKPSEDIAIARALARFGIFAQSRPSVSIVNSVPNIQTQTASSADR